MVLLCASSKQIVVRRLRYTIYRNRSKFTVYEDVDQLLIATSPSIAITYNVNILSKQLG